MSGKVLAAGGSKPAASALPLTTLNSSFDKALAGNATGQDDLAGPLLRTQSRSRPADGTYFFRSFPRAPLIRFAVPGGLTGR